MPVKRAVHLRLARRFAVSGLVSALALACEADLDVSEPPDVLSLIENYRAPTGQLASADLSALGEAVESAYETLGNTSSLPFLETLVEAIDPLARDLEIDEDHGVQPGLPSPLRRDALVATMALEYVCAGYGDDPTTRVRRARDGGIDLEGAVDRLGLFPMLWGRVDACRFRLSDTRVQLDGALAVIVDAGRSRIRVGDLAREPIIAAFRGRAIIDEGGDVLEDVSIDFRRSRKTFIPFEGRELRFESEIIESRLTLDGDGYVLAFAETTLLPFLPPQITFGLRASDGLWSCNLVPRTGIGSCQNVLTEEKLDWS